LSNGIRIIWNATQIIIPYKLPCHKPTMGSVLYVSAKRTAKKMEKEKCNIRAT